MKILITGANGQLGKALIAQLAAHELTGVDLPEYDISDRPQMAQLMADVAPDVVVNSAAYTNVDGCVEQFDVAYKANALGPQNLAILCHEQDIPLVHISTNEVFPGEKAAGYDEWDGTRQVNNYGRSKAAGEFNIRAAHPKHYIVRTAWLYAAEGNNFIHVMLKHGKAKGAVRVVTDEIGNPTYCKDLAMAIDQLIESGQFGTYHFVNSGSCSRWEFADEIFRLANLEVENGEITSAEWPRKSTPPLNGALNNNNGAAVGIVFRPWQEALAEYMADHT